MLKKYTGNTVKLDGYVIQKYLLSWYIGTLQNSRRQVDFVLKNFTRPWLRNCELQSWENVIIAIIVTDRLSTMWKPERSIYRECHTCEQKSYTIKHTEVSLTIVYVY